MVAARGKAIWTAEDEETLRTMLRAAKTTREIADVLGRTLSSIDTRRLLLKKLGKL
jgi:hypothetical protein